jgi:very-short-patch-repair endonuclease
VVGRVPVTSVARTLADLSRFLPPWTLGPAVDDAVRRGLVTLTAYQRVARDLSARGRRRSTVTREVLDARIDPGPYESAAERRIARLLVRAGLPRPVSQHPVRVAGRTFRIDLAYPDAMVAIEFDGWSFHGSRDAFDRDRVRGNALEVLGFLVLRFTAASSDEDIVAAVRAALQRRSAS